jgi:hypothetical protein
MTRKKTARLYTFYVSCSFRMQFTFTDKDVQPEPGGTKRDFEPTDEALRALEQELAEHLGQNYAVSDVEVDADSDSLIGVT